MENDARKAFFEQKIAENTLRTASYEMMAETAKAKGRVFEAKSYEERAKKLRKEHEELMVGLATKPEKKQECDYQEFWKKQALQAQETVKYSVPSTYLQSHCEEYGIEYEAMDRLLNDYFGFDGSGGRGRE